MYLCAVEADVLNSAREKSHLSHIASSCYHRHKGKICSKARSGKTQLECCFVSYGIHSSTTPEAVKACLCLFLILFIVFYCVCCYVNWFVIFFMSNNKMLNVSVLGSYTWETSISSAQNVLCNLFIKSLNNRNSNHSILQYYIQYYSLKREMSKCFGVRNWKVRKGAKAVMFGCFLFIYLFFCFIYFSRCRANLTF